MPKTDLEKAIDDAVSEFTDFVVDAVRDLPLDELSELRGEDLIVRPKIPVASKPELVERVEPEPAPKASEAEKERPKCAFPDCERNRFVRGQGYCGKHWKKWKRGEIEGAGSWLKGSP